MRGAPLWASFWCTAHHLDLTLVHVLDPVLVPVVMLCFGTHCAACCSVSGFILACCAAFGNHYGALFWAQVW